MHEAFVKRLINNFDCKRYIALTIAYQEFDLPDTFWKSIIQDDFGMAATILLNKYPGYKANFIAETLWEG